MDQVAVRRELWARPVNPERDPADPTNQQDLVDEWTSAARGQLNNYLKRFYWHTQADGAVRLSRVTYEGQRQIHLDDRRPETVRELADELIRLAADVTRDVASKVRLATVLPTQLSTRADKPEVQLAREAWQTAQPSLAGALTPGMAIADLRPSAVAGIPDHVRRDAQLGRLDRTLAELDRHLLNNLNPVNVNVIGATDATSLTLVRSYDLMPLFGLPEIVEDWQVYQRNAGSEQARLAESPRLATVFAAERAALEYESRLEARELLNQDFRQLNPLLVHALQRPDVVESFALGLAAGWIGVGDDGVTLRLPGQAPIALPTGVTRRRPLLAALLQATATWNEATPAWQQLQAALRAPTPETRQSWQAFINDVRGVTPTPVAPAAPAAPAQVVCTKGHVIPAGKKFCPQCGEPATAPAVTENRCANGHVMPAGKKFCPQCGAPAVAVPTPVAAPTPIAAPPTTVATRRPRPYADEPDEVQDLVAVAALAAYRRLTKAVDWERIVMPSARRAG